MPDGDDEQKQNDYLQTFLAHDAGRRVLADLLRQAGFLQGGQDGLDETEFNVLMKDRMRLLANCGVTDRLELVKLMAMTAASNDTGE